MTKRYIFNIFIDNKLHHQGLVHVVRVDQYGQVIPHLKALDEQISNMLVSNRVCDVASRYAA